MQNKFEKSEQLFSKACEFMPGGVNSPVRAWTHIGMDPVIIDHAQKSYIYDVDGNKYIDYISSYGPLILGHAYPSVVKAITETVKNGTSFGATSEKEIEFCSTICETFPSIDMIRLVNSGTEATMSALRLARAYTERDIVIKFEGCYHGHADSFLMKAGSGLLTEEIPSSLGVPKAIAQNTITCDFNNIDSVKAVFKKYPQSIAAVIVEPFPANMGLMLPRTRFLKELRKITREYKTLLIFDEVISGYRYLYGGVQNICNIEPDLTTLGKIIGGGLPIGAYGGKKEIMSLVAPIGDMYQAGTLSGNPLAVSAGIATLNELKNKNVYENIEYKTKVLTKELENILSKKGIPHDIHQYGSVFSIFFTDRLVTTFKDVITTDKIRYGKIFRNLLQKGIMLPPSPYEVCFVSFSHTEDDIHKTLKDYKSCF
ncbi:MAG: glutamate-1-semialdehyde 2,1-aminomutase [Caldisericia bacterium]|nr:glutamate-1-semialdehyde 2,1-aminomutase [Caldisericia bacterium]